MKVYVYLYENGEKMSFEHLSGNELESLVNHLQAYGTLEDKGYEYGVIENFTGKEENLKRFTITPPNYSQSNWGDVEVEFRTDTVGGRKKSRKSSKKTRRYRKKTRVNRKKTRGNR